MVTGHLGIVFGGLITVYDSILCPCDSFAVNLVSLVQWWFYFFQFLKLYLLILETKEEREKYPCQKH